MFVFQLHAEHGVWQRLDDRGHHFDGVLLGIAGVAFLFFVAKLLRHSLLFSSSHQDGPVTSFGRVKIQGPFAVTATVCSKCAEGLPSAVSATHSSRMRTSRRPAFTIGSTAMTMPSSSFRVSGRIFPTGTVTAESAKYPSTSIPKSIETMSPSRNLRLADGTP